MIYGLELMEGQKEFQYILVFNWGGHRYFTSMYVLFSEILSEHQK